MASIIKADVWQNSSGVTYGTVVNIAQQVYTQKFIVNSNAYKLMEVSITPRLSNSKFFIITDLNVGQVNGYQDRDLAIALGVKTGAVSSTSTDYSSVSSSSFSRQSISGLLSWFAADTKRGGGTGDEYWTETKTYHKLYTSSIAAGTVVNFATWVGMDGAYDFGAGSYPTYSDSGSEMSMTVMEIAA